MFYAFRMLTREVVQYAATDDAILLTLAPQGTPLSSDAGARILTHSPDSPPCHPDDALVVRIVHLNDRDGVCVVVPDATGREALSRIARCAECGERVFFRPFRQGRWKSLCRSCKSARDRASEARSRRAAIIRDQS